MHASLHERFGASCAADKGDLMNQRYRSTLRGGLSLLIVCLLVAFVLGTSVVADAPKDLRNPYAGDSAAAAAGEKLFDEKCADCHGSDAMGGAGPDLTDDKWIYGGADADLFTTITQGRKGGMPSWGGDLKDEDIWKVISYIRKLAKK